VICRARRIGPGIECDALSASVRRPPLGIFGVQPRFCWAAAGAGIRSDIADDDNLDNVRARMQHDKI
jgi:hypothetical protein